ncbi:putative bifunctional diguanylate cyclase/phosphodiesterase [Kineococcus sp. TBRC 1896]|uniref:Bifunctional diguanylate cyclase/phosphodiesterase n=1 Tax=Kineococcus mangrovi TaxID=1660183 RepID=A0ABV4I4U7_9ACTN
MDTGTLNLQLVEMLTVLADAPDQRQRALRAARWTGEALDAEIAAVVEDDRVLAGVGLRETDTDLLARALAAVDLPEGTELPALGTVFVTAAAVPHDGGGRTRLIVARVEEPFEATERLLLVGMGRLLGQALVSARALEDERAQRRRSDRLAAEREELLATLRDREVLLNTVLDLQRAISHRLPLEEVLDLLGQGALQVLGGDEVVVVLEDPLHPDQLQVGARRSRVGAHDCPEAVDHGRQAVVATGEVAGRHRTGTGECSWRAAPVRAHDRVVGALVLLDTDDRAHGREQLLTAFTEHASTALNDSYTATSLREAFYDQLTRLPNRALFLDRLDAAVAGADDGDLALLYLDLDGFKPINDRYGHAAGDAVLQATAARLRDGLREQDTAARLGGDEFAVVLHTSDVDQARAVARRLAERLREPVEHHGHTLQVAASIGVAVLGREGTSAQTLVRDADTAMYAVKAVPVGSRGTGVAVFEAAMQSRRAQRLELEGDLAQGIDSGQLVVHYQPTVALHDGAAIGCEALVRWQHPRHGLLSPAEFIPVAEDSGLVCALGERVLRDVCDQLGQWRREGLHVRAAVNLSAAQLRPQLVTEVLEALDAAGLHGTALTVEVTETVLVSEGATAVEVLQALRGLGVEVAVDDFGTGYSSLSYLRRLPVDVLKIDRSFVSALGQGQDTSLVRTIVDLAAALNLRAVAEGVETAAEADALREMGCPVGQGYLFARPLPAAAFAAWWAEHAHHPVPTA